VPKLAGAGYYRNWYADNTGIYFIPRSAAPHPVINFFSFATSQVKPVVTLAGAKLAESSLAVGPDAKQFLYAHLEGKASDIVLVENYR
jgi:hypothetical protein